MTITHFFIFEVFFSLYPVWLSAVLILDVPLPEVDGAVVVRVPEQTADQAGIRREKQELKRY